MRDAQSVFITGANSGIGAALARHYASNGERVGLFARRRAELDALAKEIAGGEIVTYAGDVRDAATLAVAADDFMGRFGVPHIVIANAGISRGTLTEHAEDVHAFRT